MKMRENDREMVESLQSFEHVTLCVAFQICILFLAVFLVLPNKRNCMLRSTGFPVLQWSLVIVFWSSDCNLEAETGFWDNHTFQWSDEYYELILIEQATVVKQLNFI